MKAINYTVQGTRKKALFRIIKYFTSRSKEIIVQTVKI